MIRAALRRLFPRPVPPTAAERQAVLDVLPGATPEVVEQVVHAARAGDVGRVQAELVEGGATLSSAPPRAHELQRRFSLLVALVALVGCAGGEDSGPASTPSWGQLIEWCAPAEPGTICEIEPRGGICGEGPIYLTSCSCNADHCAPVGPDAWCCWTE